MRGVLVLAVAAAYLYLLFVVAFRVDARGGLSEWSGRAGAWVYSLSLAVYCTTWTFYGSVGRAAVDGLTFAAIYLGPTLLFLFGLPLLRKIQRCAKAQHITSIADFLSARYGKSQGLAGLVTVISVLGIMPYISLQLKAVSSSFDILSRYSAVGGLQVPSLTIWADSTFYLTLTLAAFVIVFCTRHVDATEQHRGMVTAVALESLVKLGSFLAVGLFVTYGMFGGVGDLFARITARREYALLLDFGAQVISPSFWTFTALGAVAYVCLPRQFQVTVVESQDPAHLKSARWLFPLYMLVINLFVLPIALAGLLLFDPQRVSADTFVLALPIHAGNPVLAVCVFIGGLSAATAMIIVETTALSTMICNDLVMPILIRCNLLSIDQLANVAALVKGIRRVAIMLVLLLGYAYVRLVGESYALVSIGLVSFCAAAQFAPAMVGALFWKRGNRSGALVGLSCGFLVWLYTLLLPSFARSGWLPTEFASEGVFYIDALRPYALFGLAGLDPITHSLLWSLLFNIGGYVLFSLWSGQRALEQSQALAFVDVFRQPGAAPVRSWSRYVREGDLLTLLGRFVDQERLRRTYESYCAEHGRPADSILYVDPSFVEFAERLLGGAVGSALARVVIASAIGEKEMSVDEVMEMLSGASHAIETNWELTRETLENIPQGVSMFDAELRLVCWNRRLLELLGIPDGMATFGTPMEALIRFNAEHGEYGPGDPGGLVAEQMARLRQAEYQQYECERPDGSVIEVRRKFLPSGSMVTTYTDITERKQVERELQRANDELELRVADRSRELMAVQHELMRAEKLAALSGLVAGVAHEINTPVGIGLTAASHLAEQLRKFGQNYADGKIKRSELEELLRTGNEVSDLLLSNLRRTADLVGSFKQVVVNQSSEARRRFNLQEHLNEILLSLEPRLKETGHTVKLECAADIELDSYPGAYTQILANLLLNSLQHGFEQQQAGQIAITAAREMDELVLRYSDDGKGMTEEEMRHMFEPFFTTKRGQGGSGLGLHIVYNLVTQKLRGRIEASSQPGQGVLFVIHVPL